MIVRSTLASVVCHTRHIRLKLEHDQLQFAAISRCSLRALDHCQVKATSRGSACVPWSSPVPAASMSRTASNATILPVSRHTRSNDCKPLEGLGKLQKPETEGLPDADATTEATAVCRPHSGCSHMYESLASRTRTLNGAFAPVRPHLRKGFGVRRWPVLGVILRRKSRRQKARVQKCRDSVRPRA